MWLKYKMRAFLLDESGQTTVEYVLMAAVVITILMQVRGKLASILKKLLISIDDSVTEVADYEADL
jgi:Flp pilus assembly pilin Flp